jgi:hypothetical protein
MMLSDEEFLRLFHSTQGPGQMPVSGEPPYLSYGHAVQAAVLMKASKIAKKEWNRHAPCSLCHDAGYQVAIGVLEGWWKP